MKLSLKTSFWNKTQQEWKEAYYNLTKKLVYVVLGSFILNTLTNHDANAEIMLNFIYGAVIIYATLIILTYRKQRKQEVHTNE